ncbi:MAG: DUF262 domain-containing protein [Fusobacteriaceae bacterium]
MDNFFDKLKEKKYEISSLNIDQVQKIAVLYKDVELIVLEILQTNDIRRISYNEQLKIVIPEKIQKIEDILQYLEKFKSEIDKENENSYEKEEDIEGIENKGYDLNSCNFLVREINQQMGFLTLMEYVDKGIYIIPKNQRNYVWTKDQVEELAVSIIRGYPIPPIYCYRNDQNQLVILDGQQRLISLYLYYKDCYLKSTSKTPIDLRKILTEKNDSKDLILEQLDKNYGIREQRYYFKTIDKKVQEITYSKLEPEIKRILDFRIINIIEIFVQTADKINKEEIFFKIFGNLNQGGTELKNQELRNGIYQCDLYDLLHDINDNNTKWRDIYGVKHKHSRDVELLLRFVATEYMFKIIDESVIAENFESSYPKFLNDFSQKAISFKLKEVKEFQTKILSFLNRIQTSERIPNLLLESLYFASVNIDGDYVIDEELINSIKHDGKYLDCIGASSSSKTKVENRLTFVYNELKNKYGEKNVKKIF